MCETSEVIGKFLLIKEGEIIESQFTVVVAENDLIMRNIFLDFRVGETIALGFSTPPEFPEWKLSSDHYHQFLAGQWSGIHKKDLLFLLKNLKKDLIQKQSASAPSAPSAPSDYIDIITCFLCVFFFTIAFSCILITTIVYENEKTNQWIFW